MLTGRKLVLTLAFTVLVALAAGVSCRGFFVNPTLTAIAVGPSGQNIEQGSTLQMGARGTYDDGSSQNITSKVLWSSDDPTVATVTSQGGLVTGVLAPGMANITASLDALSNSTAVTVVLTGVTAIAITPKQANVAPGGSQNFTVAATVTGQSKPVDITASVIWTLSDTSGKVNITSQVSPAVFTVQTGTSNETVTVTATYTVGTTVFTDKATVTVQ